MTSEAPPNEIWFYSTKEAYGFFSNLSLHEVSFKGRVFPSSEHYFQAMKFEQSPPDFDAIASMPTPIAAAHGGRDRSRPLRPDWESVKDQIMFDAVLDKFTRHHDLRRALLDTGDKVLVEHTERDNYWGDGGGPGRGRNMLGITLMRVRDVIRRTMS